MHIERIHKMLECLAEKSLCEIEKGIEKNQAEIVLNMLGEGLDEATISRFTKIDIEKVREIIKKYLN